MNTRKTKAVRALCQSAFETLDESAKSRAQINANEIIARATMQDGLSRGELLASVLYVLVTLQEVTP